MITNAILYGAVSSSALLIGAVLGLKNHFSQKFIARLMAFGSGVLICALTFSLMTEAFERGGHFPVIFGFLLGGILYIGGDYLIHLRGGRKHMRHPLISARNDTANGRAIVMGAILDGVPESIALGIGLAVGSRTGYLLAAAIFLSNFPEGISSISGLSREKFSKKYIYFLWSGVAMIMFGITVLSFIFLKDLGDVPIGFLQAFAGGAILAMLADTIMPEAYEDGGFSIGFATILGFLLTFILEKL